MKIVKITLLFLVSMVLLNCEKDAEVKSKSYPLVNITNVTPYESGVQFEAVIENFGNVDMDSCGFAWWLANDFNINTAQTKFVSDITSKGEYKLDVYYDLIEGETYSVRPYAIQDNRKIYGPLRTFESNGSKPPVLLDFYPKSGDIGDTITIIGENLSNIKSYVTVTIGEYKAKVISTNINQIKVVFTKQLIIPGEVKLVVFILNEKLISNASFTIAGLEITDFNPKTGIIGETELSISGRGFLESGNKVKIGTHEAIIVSENESLIKVKLPYKMAPGSVFIQVQANNTINTSTDQFVIRSRWKKLASFPGRARVGSYYTRINDRLYLICGGTKMAYNNSPEYFSDCWYYDTNNDSWHQINDFPGGARQAGVGFTINNDIYYGMGNHSTADFWKFDTETMTWTQLNNFPNESKTDAITFNLNSKGYMLIQQEIWEYNPLNDQWTFLQNTPSGDGFPNYWFGFNPHISYQGIGYIDFIWGGSYIFDPANPDLFSSIPEASMDLSCDIFIVNDQITYGGDYNRNGYYFQYNLTTNQVKQIENYPGSPHYDGISAGDGTFGYAGLGNYLLKFYTDFYKYDSTIE